MRPIKNGTIFHLPSGNQALFVSNKIPDPWFAIKDHNQTIFSGAIVNLVAVNNVVTIIGKMQNGLDVVINMNYNTRHIDIRSKLVNVSTPYDSVTGV